MCGELYTQLFYHYLFPFLNKHFGLKLSRKSSWLSKVTLSKTFRIPEEQQVNITLRDKKELLESKYHLTNVNKVL